MFRIIFNKNNRNGKLKCRELLSCEHFWIRDRNVEKPPAGYLGFNHRMALKDQRVVMSCKLPLEIHFLWDTADQEAESEMPPRKAAEPRF